jgi:hypothetical protein
MTRYTNPGIDSFGGITPYLDQTKDEHNGYGSEDLKKNWKWGAPGGMNITNLAIMFNITWPTMNKWIDRLHEEAGIPRPKKEAA